MISNLKRTRLTHWCLSASDMKEVRVIVSYLVHVRLTHTGSLLLSYQGRESLHDWSDGRFHSIVFRGQCEVQMLPVTAGQQVIMCFEATWGRNLHHNKWCVPYGI